MSAQETFFESVFDVVAAYEAGFVGAYAPDPEDVAELQMFIQAQGGTLDGRMACQQYGLENSGKGKLVLPFLEILKLYPDCLPGPAQGRGDCVSHSAKNAGLGTMCCEVTSGKPDPISGQLEGAPDVSDTGRLNGVLSTEAIYNWRRHGGDGWTCVAAANVMLRESGLWLRQNYPDINVDFTQYSARNAGIYGVRTPPESWLKIGREHLVQTVTEVQDYDTLRDLLANGYCVSSCGGESFSSTRDECGVARRTPKGWAHAMAYLGLDDRDVIKAKYDGDGLVLVQNSWGQWNDGPRRIYGTDIDIPHGAFWARWSDIRRRYMIAKSGVNGWPPRKLKNYGAKGNI